MGTRMIRSCKYGASLEKLTDQQRAFVAELLADDVFSAVNAAKRAGYKAPSQAAYKLLRTPAIAKALGKQQRLREERCELTASDVLNYLKRVLYFNPLEYFYPTKDGGWAISTIEALPEEVGQLIDGMKIKVTTHANGSQTSEFEVQLVSKATALALAVRHTTVSKHEVKQVLDWKPLYKEPTEENRIDRMLREAKEK